MRQYVIVNLIKNGFQNKKFDIMAIIQKRLFESLLKYKIHKKKKNTNILLMHIYKIDNFYRKKNL